MMSKLDDSSLASTDKNDSPTDACAGVGSWLVLAALVAGPFVLSVEVERPTQSIMATVVPIVDLTIWILVAVVVLQTMFSRLWAGYKYRLTRHQRYPLLSVISVELLAFVCVVGLSISCTGITGGALKEFLQCLDYYVLWYWLVARAARDRPFIKHTGVVVSLMLIGLIVIAQIQIKSQTPLYLVRSVLRDHQSFLAVFVMLAPLAWCYLVLLHEGRGALLGYLLLGFGCALLASPGTMILVIAELWLLSYLVGGRWIRHGAIVTGVALFSLILISPPEYRSEVICQPKNWVTVPMNQRRLEVIQAKNTMQSTTPAIHFGCGNVHCFVGSNFTAWLHSYKKPQFPPGPPGTAERVVAEYFAESWSALDLIAGSPLFGWGPGSWQEHIGTAYGILERTGTTFPNTINGYLLIGVTTGLLGLLAWWLALRRALIRAYRRLRGSSIEQDRTLAAGCLVGLAGAAIFMLVCPIATQPLAVYWVFLAALVHGLGAGGGTR